MSNQPSNTTITVLGTIYKVKFDTDLTANNLGGCCDKSTQTIHVCKTYYEPSEPHEIDDKIMQAKKVIRHEIIHAFRYESGLQENANDNEEQWIDWFACQFHKMKKVFESLGV